MISLFDLPELQMMITCLEAVRLLVEVFANQNFDKFKLTSLATNYARRPQLKLN
ncbi:hypothetical protein [Heyndrickxia oleronia]|uniref:hypothetical protein n=1 Tax=Heyndrickxia oleronia TaxID=38875 RepID=UPI00242D93FD|nr:hypothetical protein [Heyndrickxia oleronia]MCI1763669.1 hypothetical protein [Heyndrickxia oleronia]